MVLDDAPLDAAQRSKIRRLSAPVEPDPGDAGGELNVVPYLDIIMNILLFVLASISVVFVATVETKAAGATRAAAAANALNLSAFVTDRGVSLKTSSGNVAPGCQGLGAGITVPTRGEAHDLERLTACAKSLKNARAEFTGETQVTIAANPNIPLETIVGVVDALRADGENPLFPEVHFGVAR